MRSTIKIVIFIVFHMYFHVRSFVSGHGKVYAPTCLDMGTITHAME